MIHGKFKKYLNKKCPFCESKLQVRTYSTQELYKGVELECSHEFIICSNEECDYEIEADERYKRHKSFQFVEQET